MKKKTVRVSLDITKDEHRRLKTACMSANKSINKFMNEVILLGLPALEKEAEKENARVITPNELAAT